MHALQIQACPAGDSGARLQHAPWSAFSRAHKSMPLLAAPRPEHPGPTGATMRFMMTAYRRGFRLSEMTGLKREDLVLGVGAHLRVIGKGRRERCTPLARPPMSVLKAWMR